MENYILFLLEAGLVAGVYLMFLHDSNRQKIRGSMLGISRGIARTALSRMENTPWVSSEEEGLLTHLTKGLARDKYEKEVWSSCITLKNLSIVQEEIPMSADFMLEQLMANAGILRPVYAEILSAYRGGHTREAFELFSLRVPTKSARIFGGILGKLEQINPAELMEQMCSFQETISAERMTMAMKQAEKNSIIVTMLATATIFCLLLNFAIVVVFMDTMAVLGQIF